MATEKNKDKDMELKKFLPIGSHVIFAGLAVWLLPSALLIVLIAVTTYDSQLARRCVIKMQKWVNENIIVRIQPEDEVIVEIEATKVDTKSSSNSWFW